MIEVMVFPADQVEVRGNFVYWKGQLPMKTIDEVAAHRCDVRYVTTETKVPTLGDLLKISTGEYLRRRYGGGPVLYMTDPPPASAGCFVEQVTTETTAAVLPTKAALHNLPIIPTDTAEPSCEDLLRECGDMAFWAGVNDTIRGWITGLTQADCDRENAGIKQDMADESGNWNHQLSGPHVVTGQFTYRTKVAVGEQIVEREITLDGGGRTVGELVAECMVAVQGEKTTETTPVNVEKEDIRSQPFVKVPVVESNGDVVGTLELVSPGADTLVNASFNGLPPYQIKVNADASDGEMKLRSVAIAPTPVVPDRYGSQTAPTVPDESDAKKSLRVTLEWYRLQAERYERALKAIKRLEVYWSACPMASAAPSVVLAIRREVDTTLGPNADAGTDEQRALLAIRDIAVRGKEKGSESCYFRGVEAFEAILSKCEEVLK